MVEFVFCVPRPSSPPESLSLAPQLENCVPCFGIIAVRSWGPARASRVVAAARGGRWGGGRPEARPCPRCRSTPRTRSPRGPADGARWPSSPCFWAPCRESPTASPCTAASPWRWGGGNRPPPPCHCLELSSTPSPWRNRTSLHGEREERGLVFICAVRHRQNNMSIICITHPVDRSPADHRPTYKPCVTPKFAGICKFF